MGLTCPRTNKLLNSRQPQIKAELTDYDAHDYARGIRVFEQGKSATLEFKIFAKQASAGLLDIELNDRHSSRPR